MKYGHSQVDVPFTSLWTWIFVSPTLSKKTLKSYLSIFYKIIKVKNNAIMLLMPASSMRLEVISVLQILYPQCLAYGREFINVY